jgi:hypothetical protein
VYSEPLVEPVSALHIALQLEGVVPQEFLAIDMPAPNTKALAANRAMNFFIFYYPELCCQFL